MKTKKIAVLLLTLVLTMVLSPMSVFAAKIDVVEGSTASITVENAVENDELAAYKIIDITYNATTNNLTYAWNSNFANYFTNTTIEDFAAMETDSANLKNLLAGLPKFIADNSIKATSTAKADDTKTATFSNLEMGEYFIRPTTTTSVYQLMLQKVEPTVNSETKKYEIDDVTFNAKHKEATIEKTADKTSVTKGEKVKYTITVDIPTYGAEAIDKSFYVSDLLPDGLTLDTKSISAVIKDTESSTTSTTVETADYLDTNAVANTYTFKFSVDKTHYIASWSDKGGKKLIITYSAKFNDDNTTEVNVKETNTATFNYSNYPYVSGSNEEKTSKVEVNTFAIKIDKHVTGDESKKLANAKFDLYRTATQAEINAGTASDITYNNATVKAILLENGSLTDENGVATFEKYEANGTNYDYYLVETKAPAGYNILGEAVKVNFTDADVEATHGIYTVEVENSSGLTLPITGGEGIVFFSVIGIVFMGGAVFLFVISRKKKSKENCKK